jgi:repressor LexA
LVQKQVNASNGEIVVAMVGEEATVKRFYLHRGDTAKQHSEAGSEKMIELRPANSTMDPMWFEADEVQIRGVVVGLIRRFF